MDQEIAGMDQNGSNKIRNQNFKVSQKYYTTNRKYYETFTARHPYCPTTTKQVNCNFPVLRYTRKC